MANDLKKHATDIVTALGDLANGEIDSETASNLIIAAVAHFDDLDQAIKDELAQKIGNFNNTGDQGEFFRECSGLLMKSAKFSGATLE